MFPENFALNISRKQVDLRDFEQCLYQVKKHRRALAVVFKATLMKTVIRFPGLQLFSVQWDTRLIRTPVYNSLFQAFR